ncbi:MAG: tyrosine-type recombinase/integrase, partial [Acidaminococcales bacterium]|nr:tyrosine-type recombinase/integrase [Acidaminococcales bacterium]
KKADPLRKKSDSRKIALYWLDKGQRRNYLLVVLGIATALRVSDLLSLTWEQVYDFAGKRFKSHLAVKEQKTGKERIIALNRDAKEALKTCFAGGRLKNDTYLFPGGRDKKKPLSRSQAWRIIKDTALCLNIAGRICPHSLRKTLGYHAWRAKKPPVLIMDVYNHSSYDVTKRYLAIDQEDRDNLYKSMDFLRAGKESGRGRKKRAAD